MSHWERQAEEYVIDVLVRASFNADQNSIIGRMAAEQLMALAVAKSPELVSKANVERDRCLTGFARVIHACLPRRSTT